MTLDQLSQTIEVMSSVDNRLRQHLSEQLGEQAVRAQQDAPEPASKQKTAHRPRPFSLTGISSGPAARILKPAEQLSKKQRLQW